MGGRFGELLLILLIVFLIFGSKRLKDFGGDLGAAIKGFKKNVGNEDDKQQLQQKEGDGVIIEGKAEKVSSNEPPKS